MPKPINPDIEFRVNADIMAWVVIRAGIERVDWEDFPDIGEHDWQFIMARAYHLAASPPPLVQGMALDYFTERAKASELAEKFDSADRSARGDGGWSTRIERTTPEE